MMADYSSIEGIKSLFMLLYGKYPSISSKKYASDVITFDSKVLEHELVLPKIYEFIFNNYTANQGISKAFNSIRGDLIKSCYEQFAKFSELFVNKAEHIESQDEFEYYYISDVQDFHATGKISASLGIPLYKLPERTKYTMPDGEDIPLAIDRYYDSLELIKELVKKIE